MSLQEWLRAPGHLLVAFLCVTLVPATALGWLGWRLLQQDRVLAHQRVQERLEHVADRIVLLLDRRLNQLETELPELTESPSPQALLVVFTADGIDVRPPGCLLFYPTLSSEPELPTEPFRSGEVMEYRHRDHAGAASCFRGLTRSDKPWIRAGALLRLGRNLRKLNRPGEALDVYGQLAKLSEVRIGSDPVALLARRARCDVLESMGETREARLEAATTLEDIHRGRWQLDCPTYEHHVRALEECNGTAWVSTGNSMALAAGVEVLWSQYSSIRQDRPAITGRRSIWVEGQPVLLLWNGSAERMTGLAAAPRFFETVWSEIWQPLDVVIRFTDKNGQRVFGPVISSGQPIATRTTADSHLPWTIKFASVNPRLELARLSDRRGLLLAGLAMICLLVAGGSYLMGRAMLREFALARLQSDFVSAVSHEFRTPLTSMRHLTELLEGGVVSGEERRRKYYSLLSKEARRLHRLVESLLNFGRMEGGHYQYRLEEIDLAQLVKSVVEEFERERYADGFTVDVNAKNDLRSRADRESLSLALWNLLDNAVKYSPECRTVWVQVDRQDRRGAIRVRDRGLGLSPDEQTKVFDKFVRGASSKATGAKGTGIGLALVTHIVRGHGGEIQVESVLGEGSTFAILLELEGDRS